MNTLRYLKWDDTVIGLIDEANAVRFTAPCHNETVRLYTRGRSAWTSGEFGAFLAGRLVSRERRDIERLLFRMGLSRYDVFAIAERTRAIHSADLLWLARSEGETLASAITGVFDLVFHQRVDCEGNSVDSPEGCNIKRYGVYRGNYGIYKQRLSPLSTDAESEVAVYLLAQRLGVPCCPALPADKDTAFSVFCYDFAKDYLVHFRHLFDGPRYANEYENLIAIRPQYIEDFNRMLLLDFITRQDDRHLSNMAVKVSGGAESFYPLYDNGRSLFYEDTEETTQKATQDIPAYATTFGYEGSYWDHLQDIASRCGNLRGLIDLSVSRDEIAALLTASGFTGYRFSGALEWISGAIALIKDLG
jgi:hypothetical protein